MLALKEKQPLARGRQRYVYEHPEDPDLIIKVIRPDSITETWSRWYKARRVYGQYLSYMREIGEYVATHAREGSSPPFVQRIEGLVETDMGLGLVLHAVRGEDGRLAPSLKTLLREGNFDRQAAQALDEFTSDLLASGVIVSDLHSGNVVYGRGESGAGRFVMIDGLGQANLIPLKRWSGTLNLKGKMRRIGKLRKQIAAASPARNMEPGKSRRLAWTAAFIPAAAAAVFAIAGPVFLSMKSAAPSGEIARMDAGVAPAADDSWWMMDILGGPLSGDAGMGSGKVLSARMLPDEDPGIRLAPWLQSVQPSGDRDSSVLTNPYSADGDGEDDMITSLDEVVPVIQ